MDFFLALICIFLNIAKIFLLITEIFGTPFNLAPEVQNSLASF